MDNKTVLNNVTVKTEPNTSSTSKKVLLSSSTFAQLANKNLSNARLPSFKPPRDLFLTGSTTSHSTSTFNSNSSKGTRKTFVPNINVTRKKGSNDTISNDASLDSASKLKDRGKNKKTPTRKRNANFVQTKGVFSEGLAPGKVKAFGNAGDRANSEKQIMDKPKLNLNKKIHKCEEDTKLKTILKDDFVDDPSQVPDINFIPNCLPMVYNFKKPDTEGDLEKTFEALQVKTEKGYNELINEKSDIISTLDTTHNPKILLFEFPAMCKLKNEVLDKKKTFKGSQAESDKETDNNESLSSLGEGFFGYLRIHKNGDAYMVTGNTVMPLCQTRHGTRQEIMSAGFDPEMSKGEVISLGTVDASFNCSANFIHEVS